MHTDGEFIRHFHVLSVPEKLYIPHRSKRKLHIRAFLKISTLSTELSTDFCSETRLFSRFSPFCCGKSRWTDQVIHRFVEKVIHRPMFFSSFCQEKI